MEHLTPLKIAGVTGGKYIGTDESKNAVIRGAVRDNRDVTPGSLFICIRGARVDGHSFANNAYDSGASCCLAEQHIPDAKGPYVLVDSTLAALKQIAAYYRSLFDIPVIGITGSVGKTTAKELVAAVLSAKYDVLKTQMNLNNEIGVPLTLLALEEKHGAAVIEMGIRDFGDLSILAEMVRPDIFIITKIGYSHLLELVDLNGVLRAKTEAFAYMKPDGIAILNGDDDLLKDYDPGMRKITFGQNEYNDFRSSDVRTEGTESVKFDIMTGNSKLPVNLAAYGSHLPVLAPAAAAAGKLLGLSDEEISRGFTSFSTVDGRANVIRTDKLTLIDDCYNANPNSVKEALISLSALPGRRVAILGDMINLGEFSEQLHREIGMFAAQCGIDSLVCHGEKALYIHEGYKEAGGTSVRYYPNRQELMTDFAGLIKKGDAVLVKASRGMHFEELLPVILGGSPGHNLN